MKTPIMLLSLAVFSLSALAADVTGTWKAEFETQRGLQKYAFMLKQDGASVTGKASAERDGEKREAWHVDEHGHDMQHWKKGLYQFSQLIFKPDFNQNKIAQ